MATLIKANGRTKQVKPKNGRGFSVDETVGLINGWFDSITVLHDGREMQLLVDDEAACKDLPPNRKATEILNSNPMYAGQVVLGDALLCDWKQVNEEEELFC